MQCIEARAHLIDRRRGTLSGELRAEVDSHLAGCDECRAEDAADEELTAALERGLPKRRAPEGLRRTIEDRLEGNPTRAPRGARHTGRLLAMMAAVVIPAAAAVAFVVSKPSQPEAMVTEAVNDHLRVLYAARPIEIESGGVHQVKPWFDGRLDFAPLIAFGGDDDFPLQGGAVAYFLDRKAATFEFKRRLHPITLFVFRADGLPWSSVTKSSISLGHVRATEQTSRGFHVLLWRDGDLGYALVSDLDPHELETLGTKISGG